MVPVAAATVPLPVAWHSTHSGQTHSTPRPPQARRSRPPRRHRAGAVAGPRNAATRAQLRPMEPRPGCHGNATGTSKTRLPLDAGARLRPAGATATRVRAGGKSSSSSAWKTEVRPDVDGGRRPRRPMVARGPEPTRRRRPEKKKAVREREGVV